MTYDETYDIALIKANPVWELAFILSEMLNDTAPIGWSAYIGTAKALHALYTITRR